MDPLRGSIVARGVACRFGNKVALNGVDLNVKSSEIHALLGPNGAGKTTLTRALCGLVAPQAGAVEISGEIGLVPSGDRSFYLRISALENLIFFARLHGLRLREARARARSLLTEVGLVDVADRPVGRFSHGMQKRLSVARALLADPAVLLIDEATHDLDPEGARRIQALIAELAQRGAAVLWTTQRLDEVRTFAHTVTFLNAGQVAFAGTPDQLAARAPINRYLVRLRSRETQQSPSPAAVVLAVGPSARAIPTQDGAGFLLCPEADGDLGVAIARLVSAGIEVLTCRQAESEMEEAFLLLAREAA